MKPIISPLYRVSWDGERFVCPFSPSFSWQPRLAARDTQAVRSLRACYSHNSADEPPVADPHGRWCGERGLKALRLPDYVSLLTRTFAMRRSGTSHMSATAT